MTEQQLLVNNNIEIAPPSECCRIDLSSDEEKLLPSQEFNAISNYAVYDEIGNRHTIAELSADFKTIFVFVRVSVNRPNNKPKCKSLTYLI